MDTIDMLADVNQKLRQVILKEVAYQKSSGEADLTDEDMRAIRQFRLVLTDIVDRDR